jgi:hypothetical protein
MKASQAETRKAKQFRWHELPEETRAALERKLEGLYEHDHDNHAFNALTVDKQHALLLVMRRLVELKLWDAVKRIENVYGEGGVGMNFLAWPYLVSTLRGRKDFTAQFANHRGNAGGFIERGKTFASLHFLYTDEGGARRWAVHFDLYNPWASPLSAWRHLLYEKLRGQTPDWQTISAALDQWNR